MKLRPIARVFTALLTIAFSYVYVHGWDEAGHKLTAYIAWERMAPEVREKVFETLLTAPEDSDLSVPYNFFNSRSEATKRRELFMYASNWPDVIKNQRFEVRNGKYNKSNWHYGAIFWTSKNGNVELLKGLDGGGLAIEKLYDFEKTMRDRDAADPTKAIAIAWFIHVAGDIHNPLHNASRVTETEPEGDQGGNLVKLAPKIENRFQLNLHSYWDGIIGRVIPRKNDASDMEYLAPIAKKIMKKHRYTRLSSGLKLGDYKAWQMEGFDMLSRYVYTSEIVRGQLPPKKYRKKSFKAARRQIALAGYRLGDTLNSIFGTRSGSAGQFAAGSNTKAVSY